MTSNKYIVIQEWMLELGLNDSELRAFALIHGFCLDGETGFRGTIDYVAYWCQVQRRQAIYILNSLVEKGVITKQEIPGQTCAYFVKGVQPTAPVQPIAPVQTNAQGGAVHCTGGVQSTAPNNIRDNIEKNIITQSSPRAREDMLPFGEYVRMTEKEHAQLVQRFGATDAARICEILDAYLAKKPGAYKSHYRAALGWPVTRLQEEKLTQQRLVNAQRATGQQQGAPVGNYSALAEARRRREAIEAKYK